MPGTSGYEGSITAKAKDRLQASISLYEAGRVKQIIVSGDEKEIKPMTQYLMKKGIPSESLSSDAHGVDTYDTIARVKEKFGDLSCYFCTQELYSSRAGYLMNRLGVDGAVVNVDTMYYDDAGKNALREFFAATKAVDYARAYAFESNPAYGQFESNCTNFVSQCLVAGGIAMKGKPEISEKNRWDVSGKGTEWYSGAEQCDKDGLTHYSMSETFVKTDAFFEYFTEELGYTLTNYENSYEGNLKCYEEMAAGDVLVLYNEDGTVAHLGLVSGIGEKNAYYCGNTAERRDFSVFTVNKETYSKIGILHMSKK
ncbi:MAG: amidase domain-containing protein [Eubacterium sp.]|nr:amidase domain-containing protein [Eubacterium sp.]